MRFHHPRPTPVRPGLALLLGLTAALAACTDSPAREPLTTAPEAGAFSLRPAPRDSVPIRPMPQLSEAATLTGTVRVRVEAPGAPTGAPDAREFAAVPVTGTVSNGIAIARGRVADPSGRSLPISVRLAERVGRAGSHGATRRVFHDPQGAEVVVSEAPGADGSPRALLRITRGGQLLSELTQRWRRTGDVWLLESSTMTAYADGRPVSRVTVTVTAPPAVAAARPFGGPHLDALGGVTRTLGALLLPRAAHAAATTPLLASTAATSAAGSCYWKFMGLLLEGGAVGAACGSGMAWGCIAGGVHLYNQMTDWADDCT